MNVQINIQLDGKLQSILVAEKTPWLVISEGMVVAVFDNRTAAREVKLGAVKKASEVKLEMVGVKLLPHHGDLLKAHGCPYCGDIHNGVTYDDEPGKETEYVFCHKCSTSFSQEDGRLRKAGKKLVVTNHSEIARPCKQVYVIADELIAKNPAVKRREIMEACVNSGIAYYTARTQIQQWFSVRKEMLQREAKLAK